MNRFSLISIVVATGGLSSVSAGDLEKLASNPARIMAEEMTEVSLEVTDAKKGWSRIPESFQKYGAVILKPNRDQLGVTRLRVIEDGFLLLACNFDYQGNRSGNWQEEALSEDDFRKRGWKKVRSSKLGGPLVQADGREQTIFFRKVRAGERYELRCNKYDPPYPILLQRADLL